MLRFALRGLAARKLRAAATALAVFLGVALMAGSYLLTDTINASFDEIFTESYAGSDAVVSPREPVRQDDRDPPPFDAGLLRRVRGLPEVDQAVGGISTMVRIVDDEGEKLGSQFAPNFVFSAIPEPFRTFSYTDGRPPRNAAEVALDEQTAERNGLERGERVGVAGERATKRYRIVGFVRLGDASFGGAALSVLTHAEAQRVTGKGGKLDQLSASAADGVSKQRLVRAMRAALPPSVRVQTGEEAGARESQEIADDLGFLKTVLLVFSGVSLFVGGFLIFNTFSITVAQRIGEFGMLRTIGASRRQVLASVVLEAVVLGLGGAVLGLAGGFGFSSGINSLLKGAGIDLPNTGTVVEPRTIVVSLLVGLAVTVAAGLVPALRATRVSPMAALREAALPERRGGGRIRTALAFVLMLVGIGITSVGLFAGIESSGSAAGLIGGGAVASIFGVALISPRLVRPFASLAGRPLERLRGLTGRLARENSMRKPGRTAVTAAALMIGLGLVSFVTIFAAGVRGSIDSAIDRNIKGDITIQNTDGYSPIASDLEPAIARVKGVEQVSSLAYGNARVKGRSGDSRLSALDPRRAESVLDLDFDEGPGLRALGPREVIVDKGFADSNDIGVGDTLRLTTPSGKRVAYEAVGTVRDNADFLGSFLITRKALARDFADARPSVTFAALEDGADAGAVQARIDRVVRQRFPAGEVLNQQELKDTQADMLDQLLGLIYALLSLAVIVSIFGIVNTLALSIHERTRELGLLRAVGMSRRQVRSMIRYEAVITALIGAVLGMALGVIFAALMSSALADEGFELTFPVPTLLLLLVLAALAGVLAAILPARRAARLDVLRAVAYE